MMVNEEFIQQYYRANGIFFPFLVSDHSVALLIFPEGLPKKHGNLFEKANALRIKLQDAQNEVNKDPFKKEKRYYAINILEEYTTVSSGELKLLHQKAKINWLMEGDKNTAYFHSILKTRKHKSRVEYICDEKGSRYWGDDVAKQIVNHFHEFLGVARPVSPLDQLGDIMQLKLSEEDANAMIVEVTHREIKEAMFDIDSAKASGPDGYTSCLFKKAWEVIGKDVCMAIKEFFTKGKLLKEVNCTLIALVPKELLRGYNRKQGAKRCGMKIDIHKAYNTVNWKFLEDVLIKVGFHRIMVSWIMTCISSESFSICVNGDICGYFSGERGLRQRDHVSPYIFTLVMEVLNMIMIKNINEDTKFKYHYGCKELKLTHMCFADDLLVLCNGDVDSLRHYGEQEARIVGNYAFIVWKVAYKIPWGPSASQKTRITVVKELDKLFKRFLWSSCESAKGKAKVAWNIVCRPNEQGGLGIKPLLNGMRLFSKRDLYDATLDDDAKIADMIHNGRWKWLEEWIEDHPDLLLIPVPCLNDQIKDKTYWVDGNQKEERNKRLFQNENKNLEVLCSCIEEYVENKLKSLSVRDSVVVIDVASVWDLTWYNKKFVKKT
ncbi:RNA-directed DNA polymerase, eukaryota, reverse transcriptase zinc-binding domain protein [Tanacetum coccineum]